MRDMDCTKAMKKQGIKPLVACRPTRFGFTKLTR